MRFDLRPIMQARLDRPDQIACRHVMDDVRHLVASSAEPSGNVHPAFQRLAHPRPMQACVSRQRRLWVAPHASSTPTLTGQEEWEDLPRESTIPEPNTVEEPASGRKVGAFERFWRNYTDLLDKKPIFVKSMTSLVGFALGDILAQVIGGKVYNLPRTLRMTLFGIIMDGPVGHVWYTLLDKNVNPKNPKSNMTVVVKMLLDQLVWAPAFSCVFFTFMCCLEGRPTHTVYSIQKKLLPVLLANYAIWPIAHLINFKFIPSKQRILYINVCQVMWTSYLSACQARA